LTVVLLVMSGFIYDFADARSWNDEELVRVVTGCSMPEAAELGQRLVVCKRESMGLREEKGRLEKQNKELWKQIEARQVALISYTIFLFFPNSHTVSLSSFHTKQVPHIDPGDGHAKQLEVSTFLSLSCTLTLSWPSLTLPWPSLTLSWPSLMLSCVLNLFQTWLSNVSALL
jgi:hypothetical protein